MLFAVDVAPETFRARMLRNVTTARDRRTRSLEEYLRLRLREVFLVHRIDTQTSGVVVFARTRHAAADLSKLFASREIEKTYLAVAMAVAESGG